MEHKNNNLPSFLVAITGCGIAIVLFALSPITYQEAEKTDNAEPQIADYSDFEIKLPDFLTQDFMDTSPSIDAENNNNPITMDSSFDNIPSLKDKPTPSIPIFYIDQNYLHIGTFGFGHKYIPTNQTKIDGSMESSWLFKKSIYRQGGIDAFINLETNKEEKTIGYGLEYRF